MLHIYTLSWNKCDKLISLKDSLIPALAGINYVWYIKDNNSSDRTYEVASAWGENIKVIKYKDNSQNFSEGMNYLFNLANPKDNDDILLLNNDIIFGDTTSIKKMLQYLKGDVGVVGAKLLFTGTNQLQHAGVIFNKSGLPAHFRHKEIDDESSSKNRFFQAITGAVMLLKASSYKAICTNNKSGINGLCEDFVWCFDDIDACISISNKLKKKILYCGETKIFHDESASLKVNPINKLYLERNVRSFLIKWRGKYLTDATSYFINPKFNIYK